MALCSMFLPTGKFLSLIQSRSTHASEFNSQESLPWLFRYSFSLKYMALCVLLNKHWFYKDEESPCSQKPHHLTVKTDIDSYDYYHRDTHMWLDDSLGILNQWLQWPLIQSQSATLYQSGFQQETKITPDDTSDKTLLKRLLINVQAEDKVYGVSLIEVNV